MAESVRQASAARYGNVPGEEVAPGLIAGLTALGATLAVAAAWSALTAAAPAATKAADALPIRPVPRPIAPPAPVVTAVASDVAVPEARPLCPDPVSVLFPSASAVPSNDDFSARAAPLIAWLAEHPRARVQIQGHADAVGADQTNLLLSYQRAKAAAALLAQAGVSEQRIAMAAVGSHELVAGLPRDAGAHRRATLTINDPDGCRTPASSP